MGSSLQFFSPSHLLMTKNEDLFLFLFFFSMKPSLSHEACGCLTVRIFSVQLIFGRSPPRQQVITAPVWHPVVPNPNNLVFRIHNAGSNLERNITQGSGNSESQVCVPLGRWRRSMGELGTKGSRWVLQLRCQAPTSSPALCVHPCEYVNTCPQNRLTWELGSLLLWADKKATAMKYSGHSR